MQSRQDVADVDIEVGANVCLEPTEGHAEPDPAA